MKNMTQNIHMAFFDMKIKNGFEYAESYRRNQVGDSSWRGRTKIVKPWGEASSYLPQILRNRGGGLFKQKFAGTVTGV